MIQPQQVGQLLLKITGNAGGRAFNHASKQSDTLPARWLGLGAERVERALWIGGSPEQDAGKSMVGFGGPDHRPYNAEQPHLKIPLVVKDVGCSGMVRILKPAVECLDQMLLGLEIVIGISERDIRSLGNGPHGCLFVTALAE